MASHYANYVTECGLKNIIEDERGFIVYQILTGTQICYIEMIYVAPEFRKQGATADLEGQVIKWAKEQDCKGMLGSVNMKLSTPERSMVELIRAGYKLSHYNGDLIYFVKDLGV